MGWALLGLKFVPMLIQAITSTEKKSARKGRDKQNEALLLMQQLLTISQVNTSGATDHEILGKTETETRALIDALVTFLNATKDASEIPAKLQ
jgi:hypothetical protein